MAVLVASTPLQTSLQASKSPGGPPTQGQPSSETPLRAVDEAADHAYNSATMATEQEPYSLSSHNRSQSSLASRPHYAQPPVLKSQYPADANENHVEYILVASFDIDRGSVMEHQYPAPISGDEHMLAELMLPDQAHVRSQDWTIFFLHKDTSAEEEAREERRERRRRRRWKKEMEANGNAPAGDEARVDEVDGVEGDEGDEQDTDDDDDDLEPEGPPLIYVLNLVNTKQDQSVKRGAVVKAMAICTRHSFLHIYKPLLLLALEEYFRAPILETLASLYNAVNSMDLSLMPRLTPLERTILQASDAKDMFVEKYGLMIQQRMAEEASHSPANATNLHQKYQLPRDTHEFESRVLYNAVPVPIKIPTAITPETVGDFSIIKLITTFSTPHSASAQPFSPQHPHLTTSGPLTHPIIVLMNALLTQKRIIFLGHNLPSGSVAEAVLAACTLASGGLLKGFTRHAFPYTDLTKIEDLLKVPGFIAGVTNPAFASKGEWWDLLVDLQEGRMRISKTIENPPVTEGMAYFASRGGAGGGGSAGLSNGLGAGGGGGDHHFFLAMSDVTGDNAFMDEVVKAIANRHGETAVRTKFRNWVQRFTLLAATFEEMVYGASALHIGANETDSDAYGYGVSGHGLVWPDEASRAKEIQANVGRIEGWRQSRSYFSLIRDLARQWERGEVLRGLDLGYQVERLRGLRTGDAGAAEIYLAIARAVERAGIKEGDPDWSPENDADVEEAELLEHPKEREERLMRRHKARYEVINQLLAAMPESSGGLFHLSLGLFHKEMNVRAAVVGVLDRIMEHEAGRHFWASLGKFAKLAFFRVKREMEGKAL